MAKTIPQLTDATTVNAADELIIQQGGITKRATGAELAKGLNTINGTVNVKDFGAVGDGVADDTAAIQAALNAVSGQGVVYFPVATFKISGTIKVKSNTTVIIHGRIVQGAGVPLPMFRNANVRAGHSDMLVPATVSYINENIHFRGDGIGVIDGNALNIGKKNPNGTATTNGPYPNQHAGDAGTLDVDPYYDATCITMIDVNGCSIIGLTIKDAAAWAVRLRNCKDVKVLNNTVNTGNGNGMSGTLANIAANGQNQDGIHLENVVEGIVSLNKVIACDDCIAVTCIGNGPAAACHSIIISNNVCLNRTLTTSGQAMTADCIRITRRGTESQSDKLIKDIVIDSNVLMPFSASEGGRAILIGDTNEGDDEAIKHRNISVTNNMIANWLSTSVSGFGTSVVIDSVENISVSGNKFDNNARGGVFVTNCAVVAVRDNSFVNPQNWSSENMDQILINDFFGPVTDVTIASNFIEDSYASGIRILNYLTASNVERTIVCDNIINGSNAGSDTAADQHEYLAGIRCLNAGRVEICGNVVRNANAMGIAVSMDDGQTGNVIINDNLVEGCSFAAHASNDDVFGIYISKPTQVFNSAVICDNEVRACGGSGIFVRNAQFVNMSNNHVEGNNVDATGKSEVFLALDTATNIFGGGSIAGNTIIADGTNSSHGIEATVLNSATSNKRLIAYGNFFHGSINLNTYWKREASTSYAPIVEDLATGTPTVGNWIRGDRLWRSDATAGSNAGWACVTTGGSGGTWKAMANLAA
jgi:polygalacturonase